MYLPVKEKMSIFWRQFKASLAVQRSEHIEFSVDITRGEMIGRLRRLCWHLEEASKTWNCQFYIYKEQTQITQYEDLTLLRYYKI